MKIIASLVISNVRLNKQRFSNWELHSGSEPGLGQGSNWLCLQRLVFSYPGSHIETYEPVAVKAIDMRQVNNEVTKYLLEGEKKALTTIHNPYVVKAHDVIQ